LHHVNVGVRRCCGVDVGEVDDVDDLIILKSTKFGAAEGNDGAFVVALVDKIFRRRYKMFLCGVVVVVKDFGVDGFF